MKKQTVVLCLIIILIAGAFLRFWNLGLPSFWIDEINTVYAARSWVENATFELPSGYNYGRAPLYTITTGLVFSVFSPNELTTRIPSAIFGLLSILLAYFLVKKLFDKETALVTATLMAFSHFEIGWSRTARMYSMMQFLSLATTYCFVRGFESNANKKVHSTIYKGFLPWIKQFWSHYKSSIFWLAAAGLIYGVASFYIHLLFLFLLGGTVLYLTLIAFGRFVLSRGKSRVLNKYVIAVLSLIFLSGILSLLFPNLQEMAKFFFGYFPAWAAGGVYAQSKMALFEFFISNYRFPLAVFFFLGCIQSFFRFSKPGILFLSIFTFPLFALTFLFRYRVPVYLFFVYPMYLALAAYGIVNWVRLEIPIIQEKLNKVARKYKLKMDFSKILKSALLFTIVVFFMLSPWLRISLHIPFNGDGVTNMAVTPLEWKEGTRLLQNQIQPGDLVISSLSQTTLYYGIEADYTLNWAAMQLAQTQNFQNEAGQLIDVHSGIPCIEDLNAFKELVQTHRQGWIILARYHLQAKEYFPEEVAEFLQHNFSEPLRTQKGTILIYSWDQEKN